MKIRRKRSDSTDFVFVRADPSVRNRCREQRVCQVGKQYTADGAVKWCGDQAEPEADTCLAHVETEVAA